MDSTGKFSGKAKVYAQYRPSYAEACVQHLIDSCALTGDSEIADIGSGTGILSGQLLERGLRVLAVEPNDDMRKTAEAKLKRYPGFHSVCGTAEATGLREAGVDLVTVAQAFHWFDKDRFRTECHRILKAGAKAAILWNSRESASPLSTEYADVCKKHCPGFQGFEKGVKESQEGYSRFFLHGRYEQHTFPNDLAWNLEEFLGRSLSSSYAPGENCETYDAYVLAITELFSKYERADRIHIPNVTICVAGEV